MTTDCTDIAIRPQKSAWVLIFIPLLSIAFAFEMFRLGINPLWWQPPLALISLAIVVVPFKTPFAIVFRPSTKSMELRYRLGRHPTVYSFNELDFIQSYIRVSGEADTYVQLEVHLKNGQRIPLISEHAAWDAPFVGLSSAREPAGITNLRRKISSATGIKDIGFC